MDEVPESKPLAIRPEWQENRLSFLGSVKPGTPDSAKPTIDQSPLTQQARPEVFEPKIVGLYRELFRVCGIWHVMNHVTNRAQEVEDDEKTEGFWRELFLLKPDVSRLRELLESTDVDFLLHMRVSDRRSGGSISATNRF